jgi:hypothetical protein
MTLHPENNSHVEGLIYRSGSSFGNKNVLFVTSVFGKGRVVAMGDSSPADDGTGDRNDRLYDGWIKDANGNHQRLIVNATLWLAETLTGVNEQARKKEPVSVSFIRKHGACFVQVGPLPAGTENAGLAVFDLSGRRVADFQGVSSGQRYVVSGAKRGFYIYRLTANGFSQTGKFMF